MPNRERMRLNHRMSMQAGSDTVEILLYSEICSPGWKWSVEDKNAADFDRDIKKARENGATKLRIRINSPGGDVNQAVAMRTMLIDSGFEEIVAAIEGMCASAATLFCTLPNVHVTMAEGSEFMIHNPMTGCWGQAWELESAASRLRNTEKEICTMYAKRTGMDEKDIRSAMDAETWYTAQEAKDAGFVDEVISTEPMVACAAPSMMAAMRGMYKRIPDGIREMADKPGAEDANNISNGRAAKDNAPGTPTEHNNQIEEERHVELNQATMENMREENPKLLASIMQAGAEAERNRLQEIDDLTLPGYEDMAAEAKKNGTSAMDFQKQIVAAHKQKGAQFMANRQEETAPAANVTGGAAEDSAASEDEELKAYKTEMAAFGKELRGSKDGGMF